ncbi:hypothetical protein I3843_01G231400 [Carya illinoinensis]|uniref:FLZ-type domain-containing protein n=1 Tax=Carya illinoinensis TaxID=32201 RepID=A0A8T1RRK6_CARIL|nr:FCS-Like Zinc finger 10 [Carya illinoinensis]KAG2729156.1 hypothetical protein I3760_01G236100 [Carya illinoinensis]KAG2729158.1 hypothetical protein I3760_01G236100 [Carya illinoinensis]KAG6669369.1 hypothetical protein CIPAW_01G239600 [Carya illinoinensis]KAG6733777.1 hypothetical protein I3842_01G240800 [Carya illinoinensis]KAG6733779.1 hypothetical protein I3842_01G240800 [Carya illinoinensis]
MADSAPESLQSDTFGLRHISSSLFSIPGFIVGFGTKCLIESDSVRSPTSPLDLKVFSNLSNPFGLRSPKTPTQSGYQKKWDCNEVGLGIINSLANETKPSAEVLDSPRRKNVIFGPQVKTNIHDPSKHYLESLNSSSKSNSLPKNYIFSSPSKTRTLSPQLGGTTVVFGNEGVPLEPMKTITSCLSDSTSSSSLHFGLTQSHSLSFTNFCSENKTTEMSSSPVINQGSQVVNSLGNKPSSLPILISSGHGLLSSLSAREIELSEDYTCIISHGPNPKTTHIFGDCILDCHINELADFGKKEESTIKSPEEAENPEGLTPSRPEEIFSFCYTCKKRLEEGEDIFIYRGEKAFCSFECRAEAIFAEESEGTYNNSPESSCHEDLFLMGMPLAT